jgi:DNA-directed RNA polymerase subunit RPC12/RpoP
MEDLKFVKECNNCHHNLSYDEQDIKLKEEFLGYSIIYNEWGDGDYDKCASNPVKTLEELVKELKFLATQKSINRNKFKILNIYAKFSITQILKCPNCSNEIIIKKEKDIYRNIDLLGNINYHYQVYLY